MEPGNPQLLVGMQEPGVLALFLEVLLRIASVVDNFKLDLVDFFHLIL